MATTPRMKITYGTLSADNEELQSSFDAAVERARGDLGRTYPMIIGGEERAGAETFDDRSPIDTGSAALPLVESRRARPWRDQRSRVGTSAASHAARSFA